MTLQTLRKTANALRRGLQEGKITKQVALEEFTAKFSEAYADAVRLVQQGVIKEEEKEDMLGKYKKLMVEFTRGIAEANFEGCMNKPEPEKNTEQKQEEAPKYKQFTQEQIDAINAASEKEKQRMNWKEFFPTCKFAEDCKIPKDTYATTDPKAYQAALNDMIEKIKAYISNCVTVVLWKDMPENDEDYKTYATIFGTDSCMESDTISAFASLPEVHNEIFRLSFFNPVQVIREEWGMVDIKATKMVELQSDSIVDELFDMLVTLHDDEQIGVVSHGNIQILDDVYENGRDLQPRDIPCATMISNSYELEYCLEMYEMLKERLERFKDLY